MTKPLSPGDGAPGELRAAGDRYELRFQRHLPHPPERVWQALTEPGELAAWFPATIDGKWAPGAPLAFRFEGGEGPTLTGTVHAAEPPHLLAFSWGDEALRFELAGDGGGGCHLVFINVFSDGTKAARDGAGWHLCLDQLATQLAATPIAFDRARFDAVYSAYADRFGPAHASAAIPPTH